MRKIIIVCAMGKRNEIGINKKNSFDLPGWDLPLDIKRFTRMIQGNVVIIGDKTLQAVLASNSDGQPYKKCTHVVLTNKIKQKKSLFKNVFYAHCIDDAVKIAFKKTKKSKIYVLGGGQIYKQFLKLTDELDITFVDGVFSNANVFFPKINWREWKLIKKSRIQNLKNHSHKFYFARFKRII